MDDQKKLDVLKASILNIGHLIPGGMSISFYRDPGEMATVEQTFPDGQLVTAIFTGHSPIYDVPVVPAEYGIDQCMEGKSDGWPVGATVKLKYVGWQADSNSRDFGWARRNSEGLLVTVYGGDPLDQESWAVVEERSE
ncbi:hypothetical protein AZSI13_32620 [Azospira sp. I13]|uniref:hypothetical protein n=1 Tax=Azospira sp. I13 TaxID=1765050 RepID=UPI000D46DB6A|nr:hypothetical protein [Azospira sp. I13]GBG03935.1 hypothetical protein AZSI13_32620 [Azospira sp. I13]